MIYCKMYMGNANNVGSSKTILLNTVLFTDCVYVTAFPLGFV